MPLPQATRPDATLADLESVPDGHNGEIIDGELIVSPRPAPRHGVAATSLWISLGGPFDHGRDGPGGWWIIHEPELHLAVDPRTKAVVPDVAGWRRERMPHLPETAHFALAPDWVCEVLSPRTAALDRVRKMRFYAKAGVSQAWLVDPLAETLEVFRRTEDGAWLLVATHEGADQVRAEPFAAIELDLALLWRR